MSNALEQAKRAAADVALTTSVRIDLGLLQALIAELEALHAAVKDWEKLDATRRQPESVGDIVKTFPKEKRDG